MACVVVGDVLRMGCDCFCPCTHVAYMPLYFYMDGPAKCFPGCTEEMKVTCERSQDVGARYAACGSSIFALSSSS